VPQPRSTGGALPPHGVVQLVPLVDVDGSNGATQFLCGSHVVEASLPAEELKQLDPHSSGRLVTPPLRRGSVAFFDIRLRHRGGGNPAPRPRPILYMSFVKEWFRDAVNFRGSQSAQWDSLPSHRLRKLLARVDGASYVRVLEDALRDRGVDPKALASSAGL
jgi:ectoine hydroxylase-related dioxygenase (phytanoyl-CoA dioxygenase family)